jgi:hypothetical protein
MVNQKRSEKISTQAAQAGTNNLMLKKEKKITKCTKEKENEKLK